MSQTDKSFTVSDRRHFTPDGRPRDEDDASTPVPEAAGSTPTPPPPTRPAAGAPRAELSQLLLSLGAQAGMLLSGEGLPEGTGPGEALEGAGSVIAILEMLKDKTEGRRTSAEDALLDDLLYQLRMAYVERTRAGRL
jgi:hypothetical protein